MRTTKILRIEGAMEIIGIFINGVMMGTIKKRVA